MTSAAEDRAERDPQHTQAVQGSSSLADAKAATSQPAAATSAAPPLPALLPEGGGVGLAQHTFSEDAPERVHWSTHPVYYLARSPGTWIARWKPTEQIMERTPPRHSDYRDLLPPLFADVRRTYADVVREGQWTEGLLEMWIGKNKYVKQSVHIPCWDSFRWNPLRWRHWVFGRSGDQCFWTGLRFSRWARAVYAGSLGREYQIPGFLLPDGEATHMDRIAGLCMMSFLAGTCLSMVVGMFITCGGFGLINCAACYTCHAREKMRRRYNLPPACGLPPGIDDCLVHFCCSYCASHQELRELVLRGVDGPGMHILDVLPEAFAHVPGIEQRIEERKHELAARHLGNRKPSRFHARGPVVYQAPATVQMSKEQA